MLSKKYLEEVYVRQKKSAKQIAEGLNCSENKVHYWLGKFNIPKRSISDAVYIRSNPKGDPFSEAQLKTKEDWLLYGLGIGLFWGEGNKANKQSVRLGNTDPDLIKKFLEFLDLYKVDTSKLRFGVQIFSDISEKEALNFWSKKLKVSKTKFQKVVLTRSIRRGTYGKKSRYGVLTVYFSNTKLRDIIVAAIDELRDS